MKGRDREPIIANVLLTADYAVYGGVCRREELKVMWRKTGFQSHQNDSER